jgi:GT2 family glycosyltransferase
VVKKLSIIIPSLNEDKSVERTVFNINDTIGLDQYEIIIVNSGGTETSEIKNLPAVFIYEMQRQGAPQARNLGATKASGDILVFADGHTEFRARWGSKIINALELNERSIITPCITVAGDDNSRGCGFKWSSLAMEIYWLPDLLPNIHEIPFACSCCMAVEKEMFDEIGRFDSGTRFWGEEDSEISIRAWLMGYRVLCDPSIRVGHVFRASHPYNIDWVDTIHNKVRFAFSHFSNQRLNNYLKSISNVPNFSSIILMALENGALDRRIDLFNKRVHSDDWFFDKFPMNGWANQNDR